jgi:cytochrome c oxidase subunit 2
MLLVALVVAGCAPDQYPQTTLLPKGDFARMVDGLFRTTLWWAVAVFALVESALLYVIFRYRGKPNDPEPKQTHGNTTMEIIWTIIPAMILAFIAVPTVRTIFRTYEVPKNNPIEIEVIGHQWWWEFKYPQYGLTTANEMHVPAGRPVALRMKTQDVLHSFWVPQFAAKRDVFPNRNTVLWFQADSTGLYPGQCAEFCGIQHGKMAFRVMSDDPAAFDAFIAKLKASGAPDAPPVAMGNGLTSQTVGATVKLADTAQVALAPMTAQDSLVAQGKKLFLTKACIGCHSLNSTKPMGIGPNLAGIGTRAYIAAGTVKNTDENLAHWVRRPQEVKTGVLMQVPDMTEGEAKALVAFLRTHK